MKNILVVTYWSFDSPLITTYTLPYVQIINEQLETGSKIYLVTISPKNKSSRELAEFKEKLSRQNIHVLNYSYQSFGFVMSMRIIHLLANLISVIVKSKIKVIHCWCTPGGAIGYLLSKITGRPLILDSFEPHAESMVESGTWKKNSVANRVLFSLEKKQLLKAKAVIYTTETMPEYVKDTYGIVKENTFVKPACVDLALFDPYSARVHEIENFKADAIVCVYAGKFGDMYLEKEVFDFFVVAARFWGSRFQVLLLTNHTHDEIESYCKLSGFDKSRLVQLYVPHDKVASYMSLATFGICPIKPIPAKKYCTPIKNGEYWAMGLPVVITKNISVDSDIISKEDIGYVLQALNEDEYLKAVQKINSLMSAPGLKEKIRQVAIDTRSFTIAESVYRQIYE